MKCYIKNIEVHYETRGEGKPVVMLHGYYGDHRGLLGSMEPIFQNREGYKRIYIDLPGMGRTESAEWIRNSDDMLDVVISVLDKIIPQESFITLGHSYGGYLVRGLVHKIPDRVDGAAMLCPVIIPKYKNRRVEEEVVLYRDENLLKGLSEDDIETLESVFVTQSPRIYERLQTELLGDYGEDDDEFLSNIQKNGYGFTFDLDREENKFLKPALIMMGKQDPVVGYKDAWDILGNFPRGTFAVLDVAGHQLNIEQEELFNALVGDLITRCEKE